MPEGLGGYFHLGEVRDYEVRSRKKAIQDRLITERDATLIEQYIAQKQATDKIGRHRVLKINNILVNWRTNFLHVEYAEVTMPDLYQAIQAMETKPGHNGKILSQNTRHDYHIILKPFLLWLIENEINTKISEQKIRAIKNPGVNKNTTHPDEILNPDEIVKMIGACRSSRDRAIISVQYESAARIGELGRMAWKDIVFDDYGARIIIKDTKTGNGGVKIRNARLTNDISARYLAAWRDDYPGTPEGDAPIFLSERGGGLSYYALRKVFLSSAKSAGLEKKIKTHLFRKSRGTHLIEQGLPVSNVIEMMWANQGTRMIETYIHMSPVEQDRVMLKHAGLLTEEQSKAQERRVSGKMCSICHTHNSPTSRYCSGCGTGLTDEAQVEEKMFRDYYANPETFQRVIEKNMQNAFRQRG